MISLPEFRGRLGNQLYQYAFTRTIAKRLGVKFFVPDWLGDEVFDLDDEMERAKSPDATKYLYHEFNLNYVKNETRDCGYNPRAMEIGDHTEIHGFFQTEKYWNKDDVRRWYRFREEKITAVRDEYRKIDFANTAGLHVRLGDFTALFFKDRFYVPRAQYYKRALQLIPRDRTILVFSDDPAGAKKHLKGLSKSMIFIEGPEPYEQLYLQTQCHDFICSPSTFGWWGAWLINYPDKVIVAPGEGCYRPGSPDINKDYWPEGWLTIPSLRPIIDGHRAVLAKTFPQRLMDKLKYKLRNI